MIKLPLPREGKLERTLICYQRKGKMIMRHFVTYLYYGYFLVTTQQVDK